MISSESWAQTLRAGRRSAPWFASALLLLLLSIPAIFDLKGLLEALAWTAAGIGLLVFAFTWFGPRQ